MGCLVDTILQTRRSLVKTSLVDYQSRSSNLTPLCRLMIYIYHLPMDWRKFILDACRIQASPSKNDALYTRSLGVAPQFITVDFRTDSHTLIEFQDILDLLENVIDSPLQCSLLSYIVRAESTARPMEFTAVKEATYAKEIGAAFQLYDKPQQLNYSSFLGGDKSAAIHPEVGETPRTQYLLSTGLRSLSNRFSAPTCIFYPFYNKRKNMGYTTQELLQESLGVPAGSYTTEYTSLDLLRHYYRTGNRIGGPIEVRMAWKYNDLKPRVYYALGGDAYWYGLYVQAIANALVSILPSTNPFSRFDVQRLGTVENDELLITYDYTSFTTSLGELKHFMHELALYFDGCTIQVLDVRYGITEVDLGDLLRDYNQNVNIHQAFELRRFEEIDGHSTSFFQMANGSLGVQGNIVFSTMLHGVSLSGITDRPDMDSCVGDDALARILKLELELFIILVNKLGTINRDKFTTIPRPPPDAPADETRHQMKYLKRPLGVDFEGRIKTGLLESFPSIADAIFPDGDGIHSVTKQEPMTRIKTFCVQYGRLLQTFAPGRTVADERKPPAVPRIIPGDWGKVGPGWLAQPLTIPPRGGGRRQYSPVPLAAFARCQATRKRN